MKVDTGLPHTRLDPTDAVQAAVANGYDAVWVGETQHDPMLTLALASRVAPGLALGTGILVAFARSPMTTAVSANDLQFLTGGNFMLGLGSQVKPHIERRFSMPWSKPAARMREYVLALRAIWAAWAGEAPLAFEGEFYRHTLTSPYFNPGPNPYGNPDVLIAGVGPAMTEVAGEVADGFLLHAFTTERYVRELTLPALAAGAAKNGRNPDGITLVGGPFVVTGENEEAMAHAAKAVRGQISFYGSTPAYRPVLELHGWGDLQGELHALAKQNRWAEMDDLVDDEMLETFAIVAEPDDVAPTLLRRYGDIIDRVAIHAPYTSSESLWAPIAAQLRAG